MKRFIFIIVVVLILGACNSTDHSTNKKEKKIPALAQNVVNETLRSWESYKKYAWGHDALAPLTKSYRDWYKEPLYISPIDAYSTLFIMGLNDQAKEIENYVVDSLDFNKDIDAKVFEVNIRILGGLLSMYELSKNPQILDKAQDFANRMMPAFNTKTGIPKYWVNLKTGETHGDTVNVAEAASYLVEMGMLSYFTKNPVYYQAAKKASKAIYNRRSDIGLIGDVIDVESGEWVSRNSHICAGVDSYYEYLLKSYYMFGDDEVGHMWDQSIGVINKYMAEDFNNHLWYGRVNMDTGEHVSSVITLYDAFFPAMLALSGDTLRAARLQNSWNWLWNKYGLEPTAFDYRKETATYPSYDLNPEIIESAYYLFNITGDSVYYNMNQTFWEDLKKYCGTGIAFTSVKNVETMEKSDYMPTFFFAETLKYLYLTFSNNCNGYDFKDYLFNTEAHPFNLNDIDHEKAKVYLGIEEINSNANVGSDS